MLLGIIQFLWFFSSFILLPVTIFAVVIGSFTGHVHARVEPGPSPFELAQPHPDVNPAARWLRDREKLLEFMTIEASTQSPQHPKVPCGTPYARSMEALLLGPLDVSDTLSEETQSTEPDSTEAPAQGPALEASVPNNPGVKSSEASTKESNPQAQAMEALAGDPDLGLLGEDFSIEIEEDLGALPRPTTLPSKDETPSVRVPSEEKKPEDLEEPAEGGEEPAESS